MISITFEMILFLLIGGVLGYIVGKLLKTIIALILLIIALSLIGITFLNIDYSSIVSSLRPLVESFIAFIKSRTELLVGFILGVIIGILK